MNIIIEVRFFATNVVELAGVDNGISGGHAMARSLTLCWASSDACTESKFLPLIAASSRKGGQSGAEQELKGY